MNLLQRVRARRQKASFLLACPSLWVVIRRCGPDLGYVFLLPIICLKEFLTGVPSLWVLVDSRCVQVNNKISYHRESSWEK